MKIKPLHIVCTISFIAIAQLLFFWLIPTSNANFVPVYPFYTALTVAHTALATFIYSKYKYPAGFTPALFGSIIIIGEIVAGLLLGLFCESVRTIIFVQAIIMVVYILVMAFFCGIAAKESADTPASSAPVQPYSANRQLSPTTQTASAGRMPKPVSTNVHQ